MPADRLPPARWPAVTVGASAAEPHDPDSGPAAVLVPMFAMLVGVVVVLIVTSTPESRAAAQARRMSRPIFDLW